MTDINITEAALKEETEVVPEEEKLQFTRTEKVYTIVTAVLGFGFVKFQLVLPMGFITTIIDILILTAAIVFLKKSGHTLNGFAKGIAAVLYIFTLVFSVTDNSLIKVLDSVFFVVGLGYFVFAAAAGRSVFDRFLPQAIKWSVTKAPREGGGYFGKAAGSACSDSRMLGTATLVLLGLLCTIPLTALVGGLLISADRGMERFFSNVGIHLAAMLNVRSLMHVLLSIPCACYFYGMLYTNTHKEQCEPFSTDKCEFSLLKKRIVPNLMAYTAVTPVLVLYVMFFISQAAYFLSAFYGTLPEGYSYADYARRGFFELFAITVINLILIIFLNVYCKNCGKNKPAVLKGYTVTLSVFTIILIAVALSKMVMYISKYGLTRLRVYTTWFMVLCGIMFVLIIIKQFKANMRFSGKAAVVFTVMFGLLCFGRPDAVIARYNISMYNAGYLKDLDMDALGELSADGRLTAVKMLGKENFSFTDMEHHTSISKLNLSELILENS